MDFSFLPENLSTFRMPPTASDISRTAVWAPFDAFSNQNTADICRHETVHWSWSARPVLPLWLHSRWKWMTAAWNQIPHHRELAPHFQSVPAVYVYVFILYLSSGKLTVVFFSVNTSFPSLSRSIKLVHLLPHRLIRCNLKSKIPDSTISDAIACMFCMAVWIKDWLSLLLSCSNLCPVSLQTGSAEFPEQSGLTVAGRYRLRHLNVLKCKAK